MAYDHSLAVYASHALNTEPGSDKRREMQEVLGKIYRDNPDDLVLGLICETLAQRPIYGEVTYSGKHANAFSLLFNNSQVVANLREEVSAWVKSMSMQYRDDNCLNLADLGCGDGQAIGQVIQQSFLPDIHQRINLFLNDAQEGMLETAQHHIRGVCKNLGVANISIHVCHGFAQEAKVANEMKKFFGNQMNRVVITAVTSIHHMPYDQKIVLLKQMAELCPRLFVIGDANSEHDIHNLPKSPNIIACVMRFYNSTYHSLKHSGATEEVLEAARFFLGSEARNIIMNDLDKRIDYHTTVQHWKEMLQKSGFALVDPNIAAHYLTDKPTRRINATHFDTYVYNEEALCFSLGARVKLMRGGFK